MDLSNLKAAEGSVHSDNFRRGRGHGSGNGKSAGKGHKGQKARSGAPRPGFEGGQMPLQRRLPKFGFKNINRVEYKAVNLDAIQALATAKNLERITLADIVAAGLASAKQLVKILGNGQLTSKVDVEANAFSKSAEAAIKAAGGNATKL